jgi:hypothetical protein
MGIVGIHPAVFVRVASKGVTGYGTWKSVQAIENTGRKIVGRSARLNVETSGKGGRTPSAERRGVESCGTHPLFSISDASKGVRDSASRLFATHTGWLRMCCNERI